MIQGLLARLSGRDEVVARLERRLDEVERTLAERDAQLAAAMETIAQLNAEVAELKEKLGSNSSNSSKPPSTDPPGDRGGRYPKRKSSGKPRGAQPGHTGSSRALVPTAECDEVKDWYPTSCLGCGKVLPKEPGSSFRRHQVTEIPPVQPHITENRFHDVQCPCCNRKNECPWPISVPRSSFGPRLTAIVAVLIASFRVSRRMAQTALADLLGVTMSLGAISACEKRVSAAITGPVGDAQHYVQHQATKHIDATGWTQAGTRRQLWVVVTSLVTVFRITTDGRMKTVKEMLGKPFGTLVSDRAKAFGFWMMCHRQVCWAHLAREFKKFSERGGVSVAIGDVLTEQTRLMFMGWHRVRDGTLAREDFEHEMKPIKAEVLKQLQLGSALVSSTKGVHRKTAGTCRELLKYKDALWRFVTTPGVEPTNNAAERALRHGVIWRRTSQGTNAERGDRFVERMMTVTQTLRQQRRHVLDYLTHAVQAHRDGQSSPSILPG